MSWIGWAREPDGHWAAVAKEASWEEARGAAHAWLLVHYKRVSIPPKKGQKRLNPTCVILHISWGHPDADECSNLVAEHTWSRFGAPDPFYPRMFGDAFYSKRPGSG